MIMTKIKIKNCLFAVALMSLALASGCAKGGNGVVPPPVTIEVAITSPSNVNPGAIYLTQTLTLSATVSTSTTPAVNWSLSGPGTLTPVTPATTPATATYVASTTGSATVTATLASNSSISGPLALGVVDITTVVTPTTLSIGTGLTQQFTAVAIPDDAPQTFTWTCTVVASKAPCNTFSQDRTVSGLASYTAADNCTTSNDCIQISAASTVDTAGCNNSTNCTAATVSVVPSRVSGPYTFRFSGYDNSKQAVAVVGTFTVAANGTISGSEEELTASGWARQSITGGSYQPSSSDPNNSNNAGSLTFSLPNGVYPYQFQVVLNGDGFLQMIESDSKGTGSGIAQTPASSNVFKGAQTFAFGLAGVDAVGNRIGYAGVLPMNGSGGSGTVNGGPVDVNDNGNSSNGICASPCAITGNYLPNGNGSWKLTLTSPIAMTFDFFIASGSAAKTTPLTFYVISTDSNPAVSGTMVLQDSTQTYNNAAFKGTSVSALTGAVTTANSTCTVPPCSNVSLTLGTTDGNGNFSGQFDQNNGGTIISVPAQSPFAYTYAASGTNGRYTFNMLGNPTVSPVAAPLPFVLYATGANRGFLLDQSSPAVMTGTMNPQGKTSGGVFAASELPGPYAAATTASGSNAVDPIASNPLPTHPGNGNANVVGGTQYLSSTTGQTLAGSYTITSFGTGTITLTTPATQNYVIYAVDTSGCGGQTVACEIQDFFMMDVDSANTNASIIFAQQ